jgi:hypothetical protein
MTEPTQDKAIGIAAMITGANYTRCEYEINWHRAGYPGIIGSDRHAIVTAWKAAEAMRLQMEAQAATEKARAELMELMG